MKNILADAPLPCLFTHIIPQGETFRFANKKMEMEGSRLRFQYARDPKLCSDHNSKSCVMRGSQKHPKIYLVTVHVESKTRSLTIRLRTILKLSAMFTLLYKSRPLPTF